MHGIMCVGISNTLGMEKVWESMKMVQIFEDKHGRKMYLSFDNEQGLTTLEKSKEGQEKEREAY